MREERAKEYLAKLKAEREVLAGKIKNELQQGKLVLIEGLNLHESECGCLRSMQEIKDP